MSDLPIGDDMTPEYLARQEQAQAADAERRLENLASGATGRPSAGAGEEGTETGEEDEGGFLAGLSRTLGALGQELTAAFQGTTPIIREDGEFNRPMLGKFQEFDFGKGFLDSEGKPQLIDPEKHTVLPDPQTGDVLVFGRTEDTDEAIGSAGRIVGLGAITNPVARTRFGLSQAGERAARVRQAAPVEVPLAATPADDAARAVLGNPSAPLTRVDEATKAAADAFLKSGDTAIPARVGNINLARIGGPEDVRQVIARTAKVFQGRLATGTQSHSQTTALANEIGQNPQRIEALVRNGAFNAEEITALRFLTHSSGAELKSMSQAILAGSATDAQKMAFFRQVQFHGALLEQVSAGAQRAGRMLNAMKITAQGAAEQRRVIQEVLEMPSARTVDRMARAAQDMDTPAQVNAFAKKMGGARTIDVVMEGWVNGLLSNPVTHSVNVSSTAAFSLWAVPERFLAAQIGRATGTAGVAQGEAAAKLYGMVKGLGDGFRASWHALKTGEPGDLLVKFELPRTPAITARQFGVTRAPFRQAIDVLGEYYFRLPGRFLQAEDEFFKTIGYRAEVHARAFRQATSEGLKGREFAQRVDEIVRNPPEDIRLAAIDESRLLTFTSDLGPVGRLGQRGLNMVPYLKPFVTPFLRTGVNLFGAALQRSPMAPLSPTFRADIAAGGARRQLAISRAALGNLLFLVMMDQAAQGNITGSGPSDPSLRAAMRRTGWRPYSYRAGDQYVAFSRFDPFGMQIGVAADTWEIAGQADESELGELATVGAVAFGQNTLSKTWMSGLSDTLGIFAASSAELGASRLERLQARLAGSVVPAGVAQIERMIDPTVRQTRSMLDGIRSRIPGYSEDLPPRRNLWGEPVVLTGALGPDIVSPFYTSPRVESPVDEEMVRLGVGVPMPARIFSDGGVSVDLTDDEWDRYVVLAGNEAKDPETGLGLKDFLTHLITTPEYKAETDGPEGGKQWLIRRVVQDYRQLARAQLFLESERLRSALDEEQRRRFENMTGRRPLEVDVPLAPGGGLGSKRRRPNAGPESGGMGSPPTGGSVTVRLPRVQ